jgi:hypothetical protein
MGIMTYDAIEQSRIDEPLVADPAERWEAPYTEREGGPYYGGISSYPSTPRRWEEVPAGALSSLREICGVEDLSQLFLVPWAVRFTNLEGEKVITPNSVLALGTHAVGLWTEKPEPGVKASIALDRLAAIEDITILLYGRLSFLSGDERVTIRYNTVAREKLEPALLDLRRRLAGPAQPVPRGDWSSIPLPFKWSHVIQSRVVRLHEDSPVAFRFTTTPRASRSGAARAHMLVLNPHEIVYTEDPFDDPYGTDSFVISRSSISSARTQGECLSVDSNGAHFLLPMMPELRDAAIQWLTAGRSN